MALPPFLRSPPFPGIAPMTAAVSVPLSGDAAARLVDDAVIAMIAQARVGGDFWGQQPHDVRVVVRAGVPVDGKALQGVMPQEIGIVPGDAVAALAGRSIPAGCDPWALVKDARAVHAGADDELALVAGLLDVPVFGHDGARIDPARLHSALRQRIGAAAYRDPFTGAPIDAAQAIAQLADWRRHLDGNRGIVAASGMAFWKREAMRHFLWDGTRAPPFLSPAPGLRRARQERGALAIWPSRVPVTLPQEAAEQGVPVARVEDGFLRSRGLGAALHPPGSVVVDRSGIYYNARAANDLEMLLATHDFPPALVERARRLRTRICATGVTKYGPEAGRMIGLPQGRRTVLAVGQVEDDLSVRLGGTGVDGNLDFLARVRRAEPDAWIVYRPHPDVQAGHRKGHLPDAAVLAHADAVDTGAPLMELVQAVDEVHVLSSLTGFEALMRGRSVTVHGMPFYAGWGLTRDLARSTGRRGRQLSVDQLVAGALILYPRYIDPVTQLPCGPEVMVDRMASGSTPPVTWLIRLRMLQGKLRRFMTLSAEFLHG
ncbi:beta-3-deoxy-D-manno-oct-2-ulosonic acid transferase [Sphingobium sp. HBC34]|uniref:Beta-3-deoxy-D-manno-oct-2-ulosonic acid transferase n=1 Tax=Sphingobium cyanobacteriorum TaxID=3063954 RepID=A0ABT8ZNJ5_9SPHN|nr:beta-3-deoxy-D-manno-oct-2-ulosonic acid transferase [Sphingobium sp. HBC34]MDO7836013.1 beta-3-deoxy-D-manno-oct-2-ulosonic acid transferase [Sphingobium sp. HBC34]